MSQPGGYYDPPVPKTGESSGGGTAAVQKEIERAINTMQDNVRAAADRGVMVDQLQDKTDNLATQANGFRRGANRVRKQMWWKDMKMRMCIVIGIIVLLVVIIVPSAIYGSHH